MNEIRDEQELLQILKSLPREIAPANDAWAVIASRIAPAASAGGRAARGWRPWPLAAAASLLLALAVVILMHGGQTDPVAPSSGGELAQVPGLSQGVDFYPDSPVTGELEYLAAMREFMVLNAESLPGGARPEWIEQGWGALRQVELELSDALRKEPDNEFLRSRMAALRARQIEMLKQIAIVDEASWRNTL